jgi:hypothetical protein
MEGEEEGEAMVRIVHVPREVRVTLVTAGMVGQAEKVEQEGKEDKEDRGEPVLMLPSLSRRILPVRSSTMKTEDMAGPEEIPVTQVFRALREREVIREPGEPQLTVLPPILQMAPLVC